VEERGDCEISPTNPMVAMPDISISVHSLRKTLIFYEPIKNNIIKYTEFRGKKKHCASCLEKLN
jgi:hypothetical protein